MKLTSTFRGVSFILILVLLNISGAFAQEVTIQGTVISGDDNIPLPGVTIMIKETVKGTTTNIDGKYSIKATKGEVLQFSYVGYITQEITVSDLQTIDVTLAPDVEQLGEVIVLGYGQTQNKQTVTTAVSKISAAQIVDRPIARLEQAIQGATPSVVVVQESGSPGAPMTMRVRGVGTAGSATPLVMINGVQVPDMYFINPNDIVDITVLKDAASGSIYGSRAGNGVLLVSTKQATEDLEKPRVSLSSYVGVQSLLSDGDYLTTRQYADYYNNSIDSYELINGVGSAPGRGKFTDAEIALLPNTNWIEEITDNASIRDHHISIMGRSKNTSYYAGVGHLDQNGIIGKTNFSRTSATLNLDFDVTDDVTVSLFNTYTVNDRNFIRENTENSPLIMSVTSLPSIYPVYDANGIYFNGGLQGSPVVANGVTLPVIGEFGNPRLGLDQNDNEARLQSLFSSASINWQVNDRIKLTSSLAYLKRNNEIRQFQARYDYPTQSFTNLENSLTESFQEQVYWQWEAYGTYSIKDIGGHNLDFVAGTSVLENSISLNSRSGINFIPNTLDEVNFGNIVDASRATIPNDFAEINRTVSYYGRVNYNYQEKYLFSATLRADGSTRFSKDNQFGVFPSVALGWVLSEESFLMDHPIIDLLKLRASWGINGNDQIAAYQYIGRFQKGIGQISRLDFNEGVQWETITQTNIGLDADFFQNRLGLTLDYYVKTTDDMLLNFPNPGFLGTPAPVRNAATVRNRGLEATVTYRGEIGEDFDFTVGFNVGTVKNEVTDLGGGLPINGAATRIFKDSPNLSRTSTGGSIASFYGFVFDGLDDVGNPVYKDLNNDGEITAEGDRTFIGSPIPDYIYGLNVTAKYKNFDFSAFLSGTKGNDIVNASTGFHVQYSNRTTRVLDAWTPTNNTSNVMRPSALEVTNHDFSSYYVEDGSFMRLKNITFGYTLPKRVTENISISKLRFYVSLNNIWTITDYSGLDPEIGSNNGNPLDLGIDRGFYPQPKSFLAGFQVTF